MTQSEDTALTFGVKVGLSEVEVAMASELTDDEVIEFVKRLDVNMASWDFTAKMAEFFAKAMRDLHRPLLGDDPDEPDPSRQAVAAVAEVLRQVHRIKADQIDDRLYTVYADAETGPAALRISDMSRVLDLATVALSRLDG